VSTIPETHALMHTGLVMPFRHPHIVSLRSIPTPNGTALVGILRFAGRDIGTIEDNGTGGGLWFRHVAREYDHRWLDSIAAQCRLNGQPVTRAQLLNLLVEEWQVCDHWLNAIAAGHTLARLIIDGATELTTPVHIKTPLRQADLIGLDAELAQVADDPRGHWLIWNGTAWQPVTDPAPDSEQDEADR
jgi:hypothetical protein